MTSKKPKSLDIHDDRKWLRSMLYAMLDFDGTGDKTVIAKFEALKKASRAFTAVCLEREMNINRWVNDFADCMSWGVMDEDTRAVIVDRISKDVKPELSERYDPKKLVRDCLSCAIVDDDHLKTLKERRARGETLENLWEDFISRPSGNDGQMLDMEKGLNPRLVYRLMRLTGGSKRCRDDKPQKRREGNRLAQSEVNGKDDPFWPHPSEQGHPINEVWRFLGVVLPPSDESLGIPTAPAERNPAWGKPIGERVKIYRETDRPANYRQCLLRKIANAEWFKRAGDRWDDEKEERLISLRFQLSCERTREHVETEERERLHFEELLDHVTGAPGIDLPYRRSFTAQGLSL